MRSVICGLALMVFAVGVADAASTYIIGYGDTLWDLSIRFYGSPDYWDDILVANPSIPGVEYLVPGMEIMLPDLRGEAAPAFESHYLTTSIQAPTLAATAPLLSRLRLETAGFVAAGPVAALGSVVGVNVEDQDLLSNDDAYTGDMIEIDLGIGDGAGPNSVYQILEVGETASDPETGEEIGPIVRVAALARVTQSYQATSLVLVEHSYLPVNAGDLVVAYQPASSIAVNTSPSNEEMTAWVIGLQDTDLSLAYAYDVVYLNKGTVDGLRPGDVFVVFNYGDIAEDLQGNTLITSDIPISELVVLTTEIETCSALVSSNITGDLVHVGDKLHLARRQSTQTGGR